MAIIEITVSDNFEYVPPRGRRVRIEKFQLPVAIEVRDVSSAEVTPLFSAEHNDPGTNPWAGYIRYDGSVYKPQPDYAELVWQTSSSALLQGAIPHGVPRNEDTLIPDFPGTSEIREALIGKAASFASDAIFIDKAMFVKCEYPNEDLWWESQIVFKSPPQITAQREKKDKYTFVTEMENYNFEELKLFLNAFARKVYRCQDNNLAVERFCRIIDRMANYEEMCEHFNELSKYIGDHFSDQSYKNLKLFSMLFINYGLLENKKEKDNIIEIAEFNIGYNKNEYIYADENGNYCVKAKSNFCFEDRMANKAVDGCILFKNEDADLMYVDDPYFDSCQFSYASGLCSERAHNWKMKSPLVVLGAKIEYGLISEEKSRVDFRMKCPVDQLPVALRYKSVCQAASAALRNLSVLFNNSIARMDTETHGDLVDWYEEWQGVEFSDDVELSLSCLDCLSDVFFKAAHKPFMNDGGWTASFAKEAQATAEACRILGGPILDHTSVPSL